jgi:uncharacterized RDD family membrane protein YckC
MNPSDSSILPAAPIATVRERALAFVVDLGIWSGLGLVLVGPPMAALLTWNDRFWASEKIGASLGLGAVLLVLFALLAFLVAVLLWLAAFDLYCYRFEHRYGATLGKGLLGLCVRDATSGDFPSRRQCFWRELTRPLEVGGILPALVSAALDRAGRRLGDRLAGTVVVRASSRLKASAFPWVAVDRSAFLARPAQGPAPFRRRAAALLVDIGILLVFLSPFDLGLLLWRTGPELVRTWQGDPEAFLAMPTSFASLWLVLPSYFVYQRYCGKHWGETVGRRIFGIRCDCFAEGGALPWHKVLLQMALLPLTIAEGTGRALFARPGTTLSDRLAGLRCVRL